MHKVMVDFALDFGWASEVQELGKESVDQCAASDGLNAGDQRPGGLGWYRQRRDSIQKSVVSAVHQKAEMREDVHSDVRLCDVGHDEPPHEILA
jgi:hypothetical protein